MVEFDRKVPAAAARDIAVRLLIWIVLVPLVLLVIALGAANHGPVTISLEPLPFRLSPPLYLLVLFFAFLGLVAGLLVGSAKALRWRARARQAEREVARLEGEVRRERDGATAAVPALPGTPARAA